MTEADCIEIRDGVWKTQDEKYHIKRVTWASHDAAGEAGLDVFRVVHGNEEPYLGWALDWDQVGQIIEEDRERK